MDINPIMDCINFNLKMAIKEYDTHHILPRSKYGSNSKDNLISLDMRKHRALHMLFDNKDPREQLERIIDLASTALTDEVKSDIIKVLDIRDYAYWYKPKIYKFK